jgi:GNAT superfamily N-acetyltransferase
MTGAEFAVHPATAADLPLLAEIEGAADEMFASVFGDVKWKPPSEGAERAAEPGFLLVAGSPPVGFAHVTEAAGRAHLEQLAVHPEAMGKGVGTTLLQAACDTAADAGFEELTLTTYADVPWNAPFYARRGFEAVDEPSEHAQQRLEQERDLQEHGRRVFMRRPLR